MSYVRPKFRHPELPKNKLGYTVYYYEGSLSTLCAGCGHDSISAAIIQGCYEMNIEPGTLSGLGVRLRLLGLLRRVVDRVCPGNDGQNVCVADGTSFAAPAVAGAAALLIAAYPDKTADDICHALFGVAWSVDPWNSTDLAGQLGTGELNIFDALFYAP